MGHPVEKQARTAHDELSSVAEALRTFVLLTSPIVLFGAVVSSIVLPEAAVRSLVLAGLYVGTNLIFLRLSRSGHVRLAALGLVATLFAVGTVSTATAGGVWSLSFAGLSVVVLLSGILLGSRAGAVVAGLSMISGGVLVWLDHARILPARAFTHTTLSFWVGSCLIFSIIAALQHLSTRMARENLALALAEDARRRQAEQEGEFARKALERAHIELDASERRYQGIFDSAAVALFELDLSGFANWREQWCKEYPHADLAMEIEANPDLIDTIAKRIRILGVNDEALQLMEVSDRALLLDNLWVLFQPENRKLVVQLAIGLDRQPVLRRELTLQTFQGNARRVLITARSPVAPARLDRLVVSGLDVTEQRLLEGRTRTSQRMEAIGRVAGGIAHDFNNALVVIMSWTDLLRQPGRFDLDREQGLDAIAKSTTRAAQLTRQLLSFGRREVRAPRPTMLAPFIDEALKGVARVMPADIVVTSQHETDAAVLVDEAQLEQVILNLAFNARDAMPEGGRLEFCTRAADPSAVEDLPLDRQYVELQVRDTGIGMDAATQERMFDPFFTTKTHGKGTGLGLSTVHAIVTQSLGRIVVQSAPLAGTCFTLYLPITEPKTLSSRPGAQTETRSLGKSTILLVEDEALVRQVMLEVLVSAGHSVVAAADGDAALALARQQRFDLLCTDGILPGMPVKELIDGFRKLFPSRPVVVCSGHIEEELLRRRIAQGDCAFISKPFTAEEFLRKITNLIAQS